MGQLVAKAISDLTELQADFPAVEARMASRNFVERALAAGRDVYIWTVNDPAWKFVALSRGVDGLITDKPDLARRVIDRRAQMSRAATIPCGSAHSIRCANGFSFGGKRASAVVASKSTRSHCPSWPGGVSAPNVQTGWWIKLR